MRRPIVRGLLLCALIALGAACDSNDTPTTPTPPPVLTDTFTGSLSQNGGITHQFSATQTGTVTATITTLGPDSTKTVGFSMGSQIGQICQAALDNPAATQSSALTATASTAGTYCVRIYDVGNVTAATGPFTYTITVQHP